MKPKRTEHSENVLRLQGGNEDKLVPLRSRGSKNPIRAFAIVDSADFEWVMQWRWHLHNGRYVSRMDPEKGRVYLHRELMAAPIGVEVDHRDRKPLNNRRSNLRLCAHAGNGQNVPGRKGTSQFRGVCWHARKKRWLAYCTLAGKRVHLGYHDSEDDANNAAVLFRSTHMPFSEDALEA